MKQEKRMAKRIFSVLLTLTMLFVSFPAVFSLGAAAASATSGKTGDCTWTLDGTVLTVSGNGEMLHTKVNGKCLSKDALKEAIRKQYEGVEIK